MMIRTLHREKHTFLNTGFIIIMFATFILLSCSSSDDSKEPKMDDPALSSEKAILSFNLVGNGNFCEREVSNSIDNVANVVEIQVTNATSIQSISPSIEISEGASISPTGAQNFSNAITYTVTAEDGSTADYQVQVSVGPTEREILKKLYEMNPDNTADWDLDTPDISDWNGVRLNEEGNVRALILQLNGMVNFPEELSQLCFLDELVLNGNEVNLIPNVFFDIETIRRLSLINIGLTEIPDEIGELINLWELILVVNEIETISPEIGKLENLEYFQIGENQLKILPPEIGQLRKLKRLSLSTNLLTEIPLEIGQLDNLEYLTVGMNNLTTIPATLGDLSSLEQLTLNDNQITTIPSKIGSMSNLGRLTLNRNMLSVLPVEIGALSNLKHLDISGNPLTSIPQEICDMPENYGTQLFVNNGVTCD